MLNFRLTWPWFEFMTQSQDSGDVKYKRGCVILWQVFCVTRRTCHEKLLCSCQDWLRRQERYRDKEEWRAETTPGVWGCRGQCVMTACVTIPASDWSAIVTWPEYWPLIGQEPPEQYFSLANCYLTMIILGGVTMPRPREQQHGIIMWNPPTSLLSSRILANYEDGSESMKS